MHSIEKNDVPRKNCPIAIKNWCLSRKNIAKQTINISKKLKNLFSNLVVTKGGSEYGIGLPLVWK